jgi:hypothetical protein
VYHSLRAEYFRLLVVSEWIESTMIFKNPGLGNRGSITGRCSYNASVTHSNFSPIVTEAGAASRSVKLALHLHLLREIECLDLICIPSSPLLLHGLVMKHRINFTIYYVHVPYFQEIYKWTHT